MKPFLQRLAEEIASRFGDDPGKLCVVLPNRRAGLYLKKYLAAGLGRTAWSPQTYSVEDFITNLSGTRIIDTAGLMFEFYYVYKGIHGADAQDFDKFADWAQVLLKDFDEIDQYLADPVKIFTYLDAARALNVWNLGESPLTEHEQDYIKFYNSFLGYYEGLRERLTEKRLVYQGLAYRLAAENIATLAAKNPHGFIFFAGLNALSGAEEKIIDYFLQHEKAEVFWDADEYYIKDPIQEAGNFIREYINKWPGKEIKWLENNFRREEKKIRVYGIPGSMGQALQASKILNRISPDEKLPDKTALVLADEKLLLPVLYALPEKTGAVNVTMGYPFKYTHLYHLTSLLFKMQENAEKFALQRKTEKRSFYVKDILKILAHPYLSAFIPETGSGQETIEKISETIRMKNRVFMYPEEILRFSSGFENEFKALNTALFSAWASTAFAMDSLLRIVELIRDQITGTPSHQTVDLEYLFHLSKIIKRCRTMMEEYPFISDLKTLKNILFQVLDTSRLPFSGEPLLGLQVMGVLETRAIDFENLVVLSVNEGILPSGRMPNSFIPFDIKHEFGLPTYRHKDSVFAYHFYRMIQRAKNIYLLYETEGDKMKGGEKSRFITQLAYELQKINPSTDFKEELLGPAPPVNDRDKSIMIPKSPAIMERLMAKAASGFSPSTLNTFIKCSLQFYFQEVLGLSEAETIEETIEAKTMGTVIHQVFQKVYEPFLGKFIDPELLAAKKSETEQLLKDAFREHYLDGEIDHGKNHLIYKVSLFLINEFIKYEVEKIKESPAPSSALKIISLENQFATQLICQVAGKDLQVKFKGKVDRIDSKEDVTRVIDYKTGSVSTTELQVRSWDKFTSDPKMAKAFQLLMYAWLFRKNNLADGKKLETGNITMRRISAGFIRVKLPEDAMIDDESMGVFEDLLKQLAEKILDPEIPFVQTEDPDNCVYCPFKTVCTR
jgi:ATP-dependent helicase/nuclease subunit B